MITVENLYFSYDGNYVVENLSFELKRGEICGLVGPSGSGKSTILRLITGLEKPTKGTIKVDGQVIFDSKFNTPPEKRNIGIVFQDYGLFPHLTVEKNINFGLHKFKKEKRSDIVKEMLSLINMSDLSKRYPYQLSGGQQQRVALARSLAPRPKILLLDEPFSSLDSNLKSKIRKEIKEILNLTNITCILSSHDKSDIDAICTKQIFLKN